MNSTLLRCAALILALCATAAHVSAAITAKELAQGYREHRILAKPKVAFRDTVEAGETRERVRLRKKFSRLGQLRVLELDAADNADAAIARLRASGHYEYVERDMVRHARIIPNDPLFAEQWSLRNIGQSGGTAGTDIRATAGWDTRTDASTVIVAVIDSGIRLTHEDLVDNLWTSSTGTHGINSLVPENFSNYTLPDDDDGHGTHVAGIIGASGNNGIGIAGVAWKTRLMALKFLGSDGTGTVSDAIECINYAVANGAKIINASFGSSTYSQSEYEAINAARDAGIIFVAASANDGSNNDSVREYPASYDLDNIVAVASLTHTNTLATSSNYGSGSVDLGAPGDEIHSTYFTSDAGYTTLSGTSMAAPHVSGAFALLRARFPNDTHRQLINRLLRSTTKTASLAGKVQTGGRLDLDAALSSTSNRPFNDNFTNRATLEGPVVRVRSSNVGATAESNEPDHAALTPLTSLWWTWTATESTTVAFDTSGSDYDTILALYTGSSLASLQAVASNDNASGGITTSRLVINTTAGRTYQIAVAGKNATTGYTSLKIGAVPAHDAFANAKTVTGLGIRESATTRNASREPGEPDPTGKAAGHSVWYKWVAPATGHYSLAVFATSTDTVAAVQTGSSVTGLTTIASNDDNAGSSNSDALVSFNAASGITYYFQVDHAATSSNPDGGEFILTLTDSLWEFPADDEITSSPAVAADGTVYVGSLDGYVYAINPDGSRKWKAPSSIPSSTGEYDGASPAIGADGTVYIGSVDGTLYALNGTTGTRKWRFETDTAIYSTPALAADGTIYIRDESKLYALNSIGALKWVFTLNPASAGGTYGSPAVGGDGTIYIGTVGGSFYALTDQDSSVSIKWTYTAEGDIYTSPAIAADGTVYFGTLDGHFYALAPGLASAVEKWSITLPPYNGADSSISSSPALGADGTIYFAAYNHRFYALHPASGATKWSAALGDEVRASSPAIAADGTIYIGVYDGSVYAFSSSGALQRTYPTALFIRSSPVIAGNRLYFGSSDAKLHAFDLGQSAADTPWPMFHRNPTRDGRASASLQITAQPASQTVSAGGSVTLTTAAAATPPPTFQWQFNGSNLAGATSTTLTLSNVQPANAGLYTALVTSGSTITSAPAIVGVLTSAKVLGAGTEVDRDVVHPSLNVYDQVLLTGTATTVTADFTQNQITRTSYIDLDNDIVQVEFSGPGTLSLVLDGATSPAAPLNYNQAVNYAKGHAGIVITGADENTNVSVFTVGRATAFDRTNTFNILLPVGPTNNPAANGSDLFQGHAATAYDGIADIAFIAISSPHGKFGSIRTANAHYFSAKGVTGVYAPDIVFSGPVYIGDIRAFDAATPTIVLGAATDTRITGGDLSQENGQPVRVSGLTQLQFTAGTDSHGNLLPALSNKARLVQDGADVTSQLTGSTASK